MPNHCSNDLYIDGKEEDCDALLKLIGADQEEPDFNFSAVIPYPEKFAAMDRERSELGFQGFFEKYGNTAKDGFNSGGYEWCIENWGTKWSAYRVCRRDFGKICITFETAWSPPEPVIVALHKMFPSVTLHLEWFERGAAKCGGFSCLSKDDWYEDSDWSSGIKSSEWAGDYSGNRGG